MSNSPTIALVSGASSTNVALAKAAPGGQFQPSNGTADIYNSGTNDITVQFGVGGAIAAVVPVAGTPGGYVIPKATLVRGLPVPAGADHVAAIGVGTIYVTTSF